MSAGVAQIQLKVLGMTCRGCVNAVRGALTQLDGVASAEVDLDAGRALVEFDPALVTPAQLTEVLSDLGYQATVDAVELG